MYQERTSRAEPGYHLTLTSLATQVRDKVMRRIYLENAAIFTSTFQTDEEHGMKGSYYLFGTAVEQTYLFEGEDMNR